jgi:hypothetical protein
MPSADAGGEITQPIWDPSGLVNHNISQVVGQVVLTRQLLEQSRLHLTETETGLVVEATIDDVIYDMLSGSGRFVYPEPVEPVPPSAFVRLRHRIAYALARVAGRVGGREWYCCGEDE